MKFDIVRRLRNPPFGTETSERNIMDAAADEIERLREALALFSCDCSPKIACVDPINCRNSIARAALPKG